MLAKEDLVRAVKTRYAEAALAAPGFATQTVAQAMGYSAAELASIPAEANLGLSCGNSVQLAAPKPGETVLDLGAGGGLDAFLCSRLVGDAGMVIGVDMTEEMVALANRNKEKKGYKNVTFVLSTIENMVDSGAVPAACADTAISNCVLNLCPDKPAAFRAVFAALKPGGRLAASDIALKKPLPASIAAEVVAYTGCIAGALLVAEYRRLLEEAGFVDVQIFDAGSDLNVYKELGASCCGPAEGPAVEAAAAKASCCGPAPAKASKGGCCGPAPAQAAADDGCCGSAASGCGSCDAPAPKASSGGCCAPTTASASGCCGPTSADRAFASVLADVDLNQWAASVKVLAVKPLGSKE
ncbi:methyltransferase type 11 [Hyaloraphidium curvatum]|nr:methyltransferase type 11 [Hyaloraphidium curvatum]